MEQAQQWPEDLSAEGYRFAIVSARFNEPVVAELESGVLEGLRSHGAAEPQRVKVAGAFELPVAAKALAEAGRVDAIIALGCVIRGDTPHFEYVSGACVDGLNRVALDSGIPVILGVLTTETLEQAEQRASRQAGNKGFDAAMTAIEMAGLMDRLRNR